MAPPSLSATIVTYRSDPRLLERAIASLAGAIGVARAAGALGDARLFVVDNGSDADFAALEPALAAWPPPAGAIEVVRGHGNVGYGRANNLVLARLASDLHLVMNPDVELDPQALAASLATLAAHPGVGLLAPAVRGDDGEPQFLCKRYPSVWVLFLRGFAPRFLQRRFAGALADYELRDVVAGGFVAGIPLASGCFMLVRTALLRRVGGFDPGYFMYFEDYDLSVRIAREAEIAYEPAARIVHHGGEAARKGWRHVAWFARSAWRFFSRHGWKVV
ncbi:MAG TPA: glycosyltransferase [Usitatibacter sp.]|nr:glycosyltransferase [Usitatibacter sp.]